MRSSVLRAFTITPSLTYSQAVFAVFSVVRLCGKNLSTWGKWNTSAKFLYESLEVAQEIRTPLICHITKHFWHDVGRNLYKPSVHDSVPTPAQNACFTFLQVFVKVSFRLFIDCVDFPICWKGKNAFIERFSVIFGVAFSVKYIANHGNILLIFKLTGLMNLNGLRLVKFNASFTFVFIRSSAQVRLTTPPFFGPYELVKICINWSQTSLQRIKRGSDFKRS